jgi:nucleoid-associated protein YgaU
MRKLIWLCIAAFILSGCTVRTYKLTRDRVDQNLSTGNQGYLAGQAAQNEAVQNRKPTRTTQVVELELKPLLRPPAKTQDTAVTSGNKGYITDRYIIEPVAPESPVTPAPVKMEEYKVLDGDTLQKIAQKFYGSSKKWYRIYKANRDALKGPDKIYPGQLIRVPVEPLKETKENLK